MYRTGTDPGLVIVATSEMVVGMERATGKRVWQQDPRIGGIVHVEIHEDFVFVGGASGLACLAYLTGRVVWAVACPVVPSTWLFDQGQLVVGGAGEVAAFDVRTGAMLWHEPLRGFGQSRVALAVRGAVGRMT